MAQGGVLAAVEAPLAIPSSCSLRGSPREPVVARLQLWWPTVDGPLASGCDGSPMWEPLPSKEKRETSHIWVLSCHMEQTWPSGFAVRRKCDEGWTDAERTRPV